MDDREQLDSVVSKEDDKTAIDNIGNSDDADKNVDGDEKESNSVIQKSPVHAPLDVINEQEQEQELQTEVRDGEEGSLLAAAAADEEAVDGELVAEETTEAELNQHERMDTDEPSHDEPSQEQLNLVETSQEVPDEEHPAAEEEHPEEEELVNGDGEDRNEEPVEDADDVQPVEGQREEEEFGDGEDPEIKNVTIEDDQTVPLEGEETSQEERNISQQEGDDLKLEEEEESLVTSMEKTDDMPTREGLEELEQDRRQQLSPVISISPRSYRSDGSARKMEEEGQMEGEEEEELEETETESKSLTREKLIEKYHLALTERQQMQEQNYQLQHKLADYFRRKKADDSRPEDRNMADQEQRYLKCMATLDELRQEERTKYESYQAELEDLQRKCEEKEEQVDQERILLMQYKKEVALSAINSRTGKSIPGKDVEQYLNAESRKEAEVVTVRLENIKLKNRLRKKEAALKSKEELAEGLHLIDFEQLKIENQTYNEKIEERNEELLKLRRKITSTVQVLTHLKEKLQFVQNANQMEKADLREVEEFVGKRRDNLSRLKQARDALRFDNQNIHQNGGLLGNKALLRDFEDRKDETDELKQKLNQMRMRYAELTLNLNAVRKKIEESKSR